MHSNVGEMRIDIGTSTWVGFGSNSHVTEILFPFRSIYLGLGFIAGTIWGAHEFVGSFFRDSQDLKNRPIETGSSKADQIIINGPQQQNIPLGGPDL